MKSFTSHNADPYFEFTGTQFFTTFLFATIVGVILGLTVRWEVGVGVGCGLLAIQYFLLGRCPTNVLYYYPHEKIDSGTSESLKCDKHY